MICSYKSQIRLKWTIAAIFGLELTIPSWQISKTSMRPCRRLIMFHPSNTFPTDAMSLAFCYAIVLFMENDLTDYLYTRLTDSHSLFIPLIKRTPHSNSFLEETPEKMLPTYLHNLHLLLTSPSYVHATTSFSCLLHCVALGPFILCTFSKKK